MAARAPEGGIEEEGGRTMIRALAHAVFGMRRTAGECSWRRWRMLAVACMALAVVVSTAAGGGVIRVLSKIMLMAVVLSASAAMFGVPFTGREDGSVLRPEHPLMFIAVHLSACVALLAVSALMGMLAPMMVVALLVVVILFISML